LPAALSIGGILQNATIQDMQAIAQKAIPYSIDRRR
jgi:hypothetical protein